MVCTPVIIDAQRFQTVSADAVVKIEFPYIFSALRHGSGFPLLLLAFNLVFPAGHDRIGVNEGHTGHILRPMGFQPQMIGSAVCRDHERRFKARIMRLDYEMLYLRGSASGQCRFDRPAHLIAQVQGIYDFARFKLDIRNLEHAADDGRLLCAEQKADGTVRSLNRLQCGGVAGLPFFGQGQGFTLLRGQGRVGPGPEKSVLQTQRR